MPLHFTKILGNEQRRIGGWRMEEPLEEMWALYAPDEDEALLLRTKTVKRQKEWLAVRLLLRRLLPGAIRIAYNEEGQPLLVGSSAFISISHSGPLVVVMLSDTGGVGVDIQEITARALTKGMDYFLTDSERQSLQDTGSNRNLHLYWSIKEAVFKCFPTVKNMKTGINIVPFEVNEDGTASCIVENLDVRVRYWFMEDFVLAATV